MSELPQAQLSRTFEDALAGRRVHAAVFTTFQFDPEFFEQEILPVFLDTPMSHVAAVRSVQLEDALRGIPGGVAVYYDPNGLIPAGGSAKQDVRRIPVRVRGIFHAKNVLLLVNSTPGQEGAASGRSLLVATLSANLTKAGWWQNVEVFHIEEMPAGIASRMRQPLESFLTRIKAISPSTDHPEIDELLAHLATVPRRLQRTSSGVLHPHFLYGNRPMIDQLDDAAHLLLQGCYLEVIAPYFDDDSECGPLVKLIERFRPREVRVYLPRSRTEKVSCSERMYDAVANLTSVSWGELPKSLVQLGQGKAANRFVHAKLYRFFTQQPKAEYIVIGSHNMTTAAHQGTINLESAVLVQIEPERRPKFWLSELKQRPSAFEHHAEDAEAASSHGSCLRLRYAWDSKTAMAWWDGSVPTAALTVLAREQRLFDLDALPPQQWIELGPSQTTAIGEELRHTSLFWVEGEGEQLRPLLVQEDGMAAKPSLLFHLSANDILRYWALLTPAQRAAFVEARAQSLDPMRVDMANGSQAPLGELKQDLFGQFAGIFHAFASMEDTVVAAIHAGRTKEAEFRVFGKKYDSLGNLLDRLEEPDSARDPLDVYLIVLCARQLCERLKSECRQFWERYPEGAASLGDTLTRLWAVRTTLLARNEPDFGEFLNWFEERFVKRARAVEAEA